MGSYYKNAVVGIAASSAEHVRTPFLEKQQGEATKRPLFEFNDPGGTVCRVVGRQVPEAGGVAITASSALSTRGWTWQENALSTRMIHFTTDEIIFECRSEQRFQNNARLQTMMGLAYRFAACHDNMEYNWKSLVADYSSRELSYESDRLPAISGVASEIKALTNDTYIVGLWRQWLQSDLLWSSLWGPDGSTPPLGKADETLPSWTWASVTAKVAFEYTFCEQSGDHTAVTFENVDFVPLTSNPYGYAKKASITVTGSLVPATLVSRGEVRVWSLESKISGGFFTPDCPLEPVIVQDEKGIPVSTVKRVIGMPSDTRVPFEAQVGCLFIGGGRYKRGGPSRLPSFEACSFYLVLARCELGVESVPAYRRVGYYQCMNRASPTGGVKSTIVLR